MKLVATSDFRNTDPDNIKVEDELHEKHVHKGARLTIGDELPLDKLSAAQKRIVAHLNAGGRVVEESQKEAVAEIDKEVAAEAKAAAKKAEAAKTAGAK